MSKLSLRDPCLSISPMLLVWGLGEVRVQGVESTWFGRKVALRYLTSNMGGLNNYLYYFGGFLVIFIVYYTPRPYSIY